MGSASRIPVCTPTLYRCRNSQKQQGYKLNPQPSSKEREETMAKRFLKDEEVELEIERLKKSEDVKLARKYQRIQYKRRQTLYQLRDYEKKGIKLREAGITYEMLEREDFEFHE